MNENHQTYASEGKGLHFGDLICYLLRHWRSLLVIIVLGAILGGGMYVAKKASFEKNSATSAEEENWVENYQISPELKTKMDLAWENRQAYEKQYSYNENSLLMKMNPEKVYTGKLKYYVAAGSNTRRIAEEFNSLLNDGTLAAELNQAAGAESEPQYIRELISCDVNADNDSSVNIATTEDGTAPSTKNVVVTYTVNYMKKNGCQRMLGVLEDRANALNKELQKEYGGFTCDSLGSSVVLGVNSGYLSQQKTSIDYLQSYSNNFNSLESGFTGQDLEYYQITYLNKTVEEVQPAAFSGNKIKYLIVGVFLLCCCWGVVLVLRYLLDGRVRNAEELKNCYPQPVLGQLKLSAPKKGLDGAVEKLEALANGGLVTPEYVAQAVSLMHPEQLMLCVDADADMTEKLKRAMKEGCPALALNQYPNRSSAALEKAIRSDGILLAVQKNRTSYREIERCIEMCSLQNIRIVGFVCVE